MNFRAPFTRGLGPRIAGPDPLAALRPRAKGQPAIDAFENSSMQTEDGVVGRLGNS
jgi:hypothetical protein